MKLRFDLTIKIPDLFKFLERHTHCDGRVLIRAPLERQSDCFLLKSVKAHYSCYDLSAGGIDGYDKVNLNELIFTLVST
jgi:hypothetical protein